LKQLLVVVQQLHTGFIGPTRLSEGLPSWALPASFTDRWERWMETGRSFFDAQLELDHATWRFVAAQGVFDNAVCAGVWRMSEDLAGRRYPLLIASVGNAPSPWDAWFDRADQIVSDTIERSLLHRSLAHRIASLPKYSAARTPDVAARFWIDDWQVYELLYATAYDLARTGLNDMLAPTRKARTPDNG
jgi:type VI secretion system ImpM family protein